MCVTTANTEWLRSLSGCALLFVSKVSGTTLESGWRDQKDDVNPSPAVNLQLWACPKLFWALQPGVCASLQAETHSIFFIHSLFVINLSCSLHYKRVGGNCLNMTWQTRVRKRLHAFGSDHQQLMVNANDASLSSWLLRPPLDNLPEKPQIFYLV